MIKRLFVGSAARLDAVSPAVVARFGDDYSIVRTGPRFLEVMAPGVDKGRAVLALGRRLGITAAEMMAFGDQKNDLPLFAAVGVGVCMANGTAEAQAAADYVTASNDEDGIANAIARFVV